MAGVQELVRFKAAKKNFSDACAKFLEYHHENAREVWQWRKTGDGDPDVIAEYIEKSKEVDECKKEVRALSQQMAKRYKEKPV